MRSSTASAGHQGPVVVRVTVAAGAGHADLVCRQHHCRHTPGPVNPGIGMKNVRERLAVQFEGRASLSAGPRGAEWIAEINMPEIHDLRDRRDIGRAAPLVGAA